MAGMPVSSPAITAPSAKVRRSRRADEKPHAQTLLWALKPFSNLRGSIPLPFVTIFLMVALDEGRGVTAYARAIGMHRAAMSRYLRDVGARARNGGPGLGLIIVKPHPTNLRRTQVFLTAKGRFVIREVARRLRKAESTIASARQRNGRGSGRRPASMNIVKDNSASPS